MVHLNLYVTNPELDLQTNQLLLCNKTMSSFSGPRRSEAKVLKAKKRLNIIQREVRCEC